MADSFVRGEDYDKMRWVAEGAIKEADEVPPEAMRQLLIEFARQEPSIKERDYMTVKNTIEFLVTKYTGGGEQIVPPPDDNNVHKLHSIDGDIPDDVPNDDVRFSGEITEEDFMSQFMSAPDPSPQPPDEEVMQAMARQQLREFQQKIYDAMIEYLKAKEHYDALIAAPEGHYSKAARDAARERYAMAELTRSAASMGHPNVLLDD